MQASRFHPHVKRTWALAATAWLAAGCQQPIPECQVARLPYVARYNLVPNSIAPPTNPTCAYLQNLKGDILGLHTYYHPTPEGRADYLRARVAIKPDLVAVLEEKEREAGVPLQPQQPPYSLGDFDQGRPLDGFCTAQVMAPIDREFNVPDMLTMLPTTKVRYAWSNFSALVTAAYTGTQMYARLDYSKNGCSASYDVWAMSIDTGKYHDLVDNGVEKGAEARCKTVEDCFSGWAINPDFAIECLPGFAPGQEGPVADGTGTCVLAAPPPALLQ